MNLPYVSRCQGIGGVIKALPEHFRVKEIPLYQASGEGQHIYATITKKDLTTKDLVRKLQIAFNLQESDIGYAGQKDKKGITTQIISLSVGRSFSIDKATEIISTNIPSVTIESLERHENKIKIGHLVGNHFEIFVSDVEENALKYSQIINGELTATGVPNYYGEQRFGSKNDNSERGKDILTNNAKGKKTFKKFLISAYQSNLFNKWLSNRISNNYFEKIIDGDVMQSIGGGRPFIFSNTERQNQEYKDHLITYTGPMFGHKMFEAKERELEIESKIFLEENISIDNYKKQKVIGARRSAKMFIHDMKIVPEENGLWFKFSLPKGSYATSVMREFMKNDTSSKT